MNEQRINLALSILIVAAALAVASGAACWYFHHLMEIGTFGGVDCCRMPR